MIAELILRPFFWFAQAIAALLLPVKSKKLARLKRVAAPFLVLGAISMLLSFIPTNGWYSLAFFGAGFVFFGFAGATGHYIEMESLNERD